MWLCLLYSCVLINLVNSNNYLNKKTEELPYNIYNNAKNSAKLINLIQKFDNNKVSEDSELPTHQANVLDIKDGNIYEKMKLLQKNYDVDQKLKKDKSKTEAQFHYLKNPAVLETYRKQIARRNKKNIDSVEDQTRSYVKEAIRNSRLTLHNLKADNKNKYNRKHNRHLNEKQLYDNTNINRHTDKDLFEYSIDEANDESLQLKPLLTKVINKLQEKNNVMIEFDENSHEINSQRYFTSHEKENKRDVINAEILADEKEDIKEEHMSDELKRHENQGSQFNKNHWAIQTSKTYTADINPNNDMKSHLPKENNENNGPKLSQNYYFKDSNEHIDKDTNNGKNKKYNEFNIEEKRNNKLNSNEKQYKRPKEHNNKKVNNLKNKEIKVKDEEKLNVETNENWKNKQNRWSKEKNQDIKHDDSTSIHTTNDSQEYWNQNTNHQNEKDKKELMTKDWSRKTDTWNDFYSQKMFKKRKENQSIQVDKSFERLNKNNDNWNTNMDNSNEPKRDDLKWHKNDKSEDLMKIKVNPWNKNDDSWDKKHDSWNKKDDTLNPKDDTWNKEDDIWNKNDNNWNKKDDKWINKDDSLNKRDDSWIKKDDSLNKRDDSWIKKDDSWNNKGLSAKKTHGLRDIVSEDELNGAENIKIPKHNPFQLNKDNSNWGSYDTFKSKKIWGGYSNENKNYQRPRNTYRDSGERQNIRNVPFGRTPIPFMKKKSIYV